MCSLGKAKPVRLVRAVVMRKKAVHDHEARPDAEQADDHMHGRERSGRHPQNHAAPPPTEMWSIVRLPATPAPKTPCHPERSETTYAPWQHHDGRQANRSCALLRMTTLCRTPSLRAQRTTTTNRAIHGRDTRGACPH